MSISEHVTIGVAVWLLIALVSAMIAMDSKSGFARISFGSLAIAAALFLYSASGGFDASGAARASLFGDADE